MRYAMIMAGGSGTRLWPLSRTARPKQLLPLIPDAADPDAPPRSLLELAAARTDGLVPPERRYICTAEAFRAQIKSALPQFSDDRILGEPVGRDTVNAVGFAAAVFHKLHKDATFVVLTADHLITPESRFRELVDLGFRLVEQDPKRLVTFSIKPTHAATGFGYVERGQPIRTPPPAAPAPHKKGAAQAPPSPAAPAPDLAFKVARFVEKPDAPRAQAYLESGHFGWNSGMFVFGAATFLECLNRYKPESHEGLARIAAAWGTRDQKRTIDEVYPTLPRISVDYAVMEPASKEAGSGGGGGGGVSVCTVLADIDWLDVGSWPSYAETLRPDADGNRTGGRVKSVMVDTTGSLIVGDDPGHTVAVLGMKDVVVVHTKDATLVMPRDKAEGLKRLHGLVDEELK